MTATFDRMDNVSHKDLQPAPGLQANGFEYLSEVRNVQASNLPAKDTADSHLAPITITDDKKACTEEGFFDKAWRMLQNATMDSGAAEAGIILPPGSHLEAPSCKATPKADASGPSGSGDKGDVLPPLSIEPDSKGGAGDNKLHFYDWDRRTVLPNEKHSTNLEYGEVIPETKDGKATTPPEPNGLAPARPEENRGVLPGTEKPTDKSTDKSDDKLSVKPTDKPDGTLADKAADKPETKQADKPGENAPGSDTTGNDKPTVRPNEGPDNNLHDVPSARKPGVTDEVQKHLGKTPGDIQPGINPRLGCALMVSHVLHEADPSFPITNNSATLRRLLKEHGYEAVTVKPGDQALGKTHAGDVIVGSRPDGMPSHAALSMGDGRVYNNNSDAGRTQLDSVDQFNQGMHDKGGHWNKNGFSDVTIYRKKAA